MKRWLGLGNFSSTYLSLFEGLLMVFSILIIAPYFILTYFNNPSIDDFSFAIKTLDLGYWQAQVSAYTIWNGRYFSSFVLSAHPMVFESYLFFCSFLFFRNSFVFQDSHFSTYCVILIPCCVKMFSILSFSKHIPLIRGSAN